MPHMSMRVVSLAALMSFMLLAAGCGDSGEAGTIRTSPAAEVQRADVVPLRNQPQIFAEDIQLATGSTLTLLRTPIGRLRATCIAGHVMTTFVPARSLASADVVVRSGRRVRGGTVIPGKKFAAPRMADPDIQTWSIAEFAEGDVRPTVITVAARASAWGTTYSCAVSALATVGAPTGTVTM